MNFVKQELEEFCRKTRLKWHLRNDPTPKSSTTLAFNPKSTCKPPNNNSPNLELFLSQVEKSLSKIIRCL